MDSAVDDPLDHLVRVVREQRAQLVRVAQREGMGAEDAVDCVHDAFCTFLRLGLTGQLPAEIVPAAFLAGVVRNAARNRRRLHHNSRPHLPLDQAPLDPAADAEGELARAEEHIRLHACVDRLCDTQRAVVSLRLLEERGGEDVARELGISRGYVDVLLLRAKRALTSCMRDSS